VKGSDADLILALCDIRCWFFMNLAPDPKYLEIFHKSWISKRGLPAGFIVLRLDADFQVWTRILTISASSISSASGRGFSSLDADFDNFCVQYLFCVWTIDT